jgi:osmotically-inducible protein OsmY
VHAAAGHARPQTAVTISKSVPSVTVSNRRHLQIACLLGMMLVTGCRGADGDLRHRALQALASDPATAQLPITLKVRSAVATVSGDVSNRAEQKRALEIVSGTTGVLDVIDDLRIDDRIIIQNARRAFAADPLIKDVPVEMTSNDGVLTLRSEQTNEEQRRRMVQIATTVDGVIDIVDDMK